MKEDPTAHVPVEIRSVHRSVPCIEMVSGVAPQQLIRLEEGVTTIGRSERATITIPDDGLSRLHVKIVLRGETAQVIDLESRNGTYVNGEAVDAAVLSEGARIQLANNVILAYGHHSENEVALRSGGSPNLDAIALRPRERDVAKLVAQDLSNAEVAERLGISPRTVSTHLTNIYERLGIHSRVALTAYVYRHGLLVEGERT